LYRAGGPTGRANAHEMIDLPADAEVITASSISVPDR
jgi:hypothetical protein